MRINIWITSDHHFDHSNILKYEKENRPFKDVEEMNEYFIKQWNHYVRDCDIVYYLGDLNSTQNHKIKAIMQRLNGTKILILGNHDKYTIGAYYKMGFSAVLREAILPVNKNINVKLAHLPYCLDRNEYPDKFKDTRPIPEKDYWLIHGHCHSRWQIRPDLKMINISWDAWHRPLRLVEIRDIIEKEEAKLKKE